MLVILYHLPSFTYEKNMGKKSCLLGARWFGIQARGSQTTGKYLKKRRHSIFRDDGTYQKYIIFQRKNGTYFPNPSNQGWMMEHTFKKKYLILFHFEGWNIPEISRDIPIFVHGKYLKIPKT
jgi:hypothetical protein